MASKMDYVDKFVSPTNRPLLETVLDQGDDTERHLLEIAHYITDWEVKLVRLLGLTNEEVEDIKAKITDPELRRRQVLRVWRNKEGLNATYGRLLDKCSQGKCHKAAEKIHEIILVSHARLEIIRNREAAFGRQLQASIKQEQEDDVSVTIVKRNLANIQGKFATLITDIADNLTMKSIDMDKFLLYITTLFPPGDFIAYAKTVAEVFKAITHHQLWDFSSFTPVEEIAEKFGEKDPLLNGWISDYKSRLAGFKAVTKIADYIKASNDEEDIADSEQSIRQNIARYDKRYCRKLSIKLKPARITEKSLDYIDQFWRSIADYFVLPSLSVLLDTIKEGCVEVTWLVPTVPALQMEANMEDSEDVWRNLEVTRVEMDGVVLYHAPEANMEDPEELLEVTVADNSDDEKNTQPLKERTDHGEHELLREVDAMMNLHEEDSNILKSFIKDKSENDLNNLYITAVKENRMEVVRSVLNSAAVDIDTKEKDEYGWTALLWGCEKGHEDMVEYLLEQGANPNAKDVSKWTGLILSSQRGRLEIVRKLLDKGANPNQQTSSGWSSLQWTAQEGHTEVAKLLLERGADPTQHDNVGFTPLIQASQDGHIDIVKAIVEYNSAHLQEDLDQITEGGWSAVMVASKNGHTDIVKYLAEAEFDMHYAKKDDVTALHIASHTGCVDIVRYMCNEGKMHINAQDVDGVTSLMYAIKQGDLAVTRTLIEDGNADANIAENHNQWTALFFALEGIKNRDLKIFEYLLSLEKRRVDIEHKDRNGRTIWEVTEMFDNCEEARKLLKQYYKPEMERMIDRSKRKLTIKDYQQMLDKMNTKINVQLRKKAVAANAA